MLKNRKDLIFSESTNPRLTFRMQGLSVLQFLQTLTFVTQDSQSTPVISPIAVSLQAVSCEGTSLHIAFLATVTKRLAFISPALAPTYQ
jgi:hypothetical protein